MDNHHVYISESRMSCGVLELSDMKSDPIKTLYAIATHLYHPARGAPAAFVLWSDVTLKAVRSNGQALASMISQLELAANGLTTTAPHENPKTSNPIQVYLWSLPHDKFREWYKAERVRRALRV
jgi:hypothetical protein